MQQIKNSFSQKYIEIDYSDAKTFVNRYRVQYVVLRAFHTKSHK